MTQTLSYEEQAEKAINPVKLANMAASGGRNGSWMTEMCCKASESMCQAGPAVARSTRQTENEFMEGFAI